MIALGGVVLCLVLLNGCSFGYLWHVTVGQAKLLARQRPVEEVLQDTSLSDQERQKIRLIQEAKKFAVEHLGLHASDSYTTFVRVDGPYVSYNLSAAPKDALQPYVWHFPIVGHMPFKGFFKEEYALREQRQLDAQGYDTYVRGVRAYSTLGYFDDPILSSMLHAHDYSLINTTIHELLHQTVWFKGYVSFNESLASFVGEQGTSAYLTTQYGESSPELQQYRAIQADAAVFRAYIQALIERLEALYEQPLSFEEKMRRREQVFAEAKTDYPTVFPRMKTPYYRRYFERQPLNNAVLMSFRRYHHDTTFFEQTLADHDHDLRQTIDFFKTLRPDQIPETFRTHSVKSF
jgi:predicted aminopeptidase